MNEKYYKNIENAIEELVIAIEEYYEKVLNEYAQIDCAQPQHKVLNDCKLALTMIPQYKANCMHDIIMNHDDLSKYLG